MSRLSPFEFTIEFTFIKVRVNSKVNSSAKVKVKNPIALSVIVRII